MINKLFIVLLLVLSIFPGCKPNIEPVPPPPPPLPPTDIPESPAVDNTEPAVEILSSPVEAIEGQDITFQWHGSDDRTSVSDITYSFYLQNYDETYSSFTSATAKTYSDLPAGTYTFYVKSKDKAGNISSNPATVEIIIIVVEKEKEEALPPFAGELLILSNSEVNRIAVSKYDSVIYALDSANGNIYKSKHGGFGWSKISSRITGTPTWDDFAIAPDNHDIIAVATDAGTEVWLSLDGGDNFFTSGLSGKLGGGERIKCLAVSSAYGNNVHEVAIGTSTGNGHGRVLINVFSMIGSSR